MSPQELDTTISLVTGYLLGAATIIIIIAPVAMWHIGKPLLPSKPKQHLTPEARAAQFRTWLRGPRT